MSYLFIYNAVVGLLFGGLYCWGFHTTSEIIIDKSIYESIKEGRKHINSEKIFIASVFFPLTWMIYVFLILVQVARTLDEN